MVKTIAISDVTYKEISEIKQELNSVSMDETLKRLITEYKRLLKQLSIKGLFALSKNDKTTVEQLLADRRRYGWPRELY